MNNWQYVESKGAWNSLLSQFENVSLQQSWQWGDVNIALGHGVARYLLGDTTNPQAAMQVIVKSAKRGRYLEVPAGPMVDWSDGRLVAEVIGKLHATAKAERCVFVRFRPQLSDDPRHRALLQQLGAKPSPMHISADHTSIVDLEPSTDELLVAMRQQTRYEVRRASKRGVVVEESKDPDLVETFHQLQSDTAKRQGFVAPSKRYLAACIDAFGDNAHVYKATKNGQLLNIALVVWFGQEAAYFEAASSPEARREPGAYAIVWHAIQAAKSAGLTRFNLWGTAPSDAPHHRYAGVTTFKRGFSGSDVAYVSAHDIAVRSLAYTATRLFELARKKRRKL